MLVQASSANGRARATGLRGIRATAAQRRCPPCQRHRRAGLCFALRCTKPSGVSSGAPVPFEVIVMQHDSSRGSRPRAFRSVCCASVLGVLLALAGCKSTEPGSSASSANAASANAPAKIELNNERTATAEVVAVDKATRGLTLRREDGAMLSIRCPAEVRNYDQIAAGNQLRVRYKQTLGVAKSNAAEPADAKLAVAAARAPKGAMPAAAAGAGIHVIVKIESIDLENNVVTFSLASGELVAHRIATPEGRAFVRGLKLGDKVELRYSESVALSVEAL